MNRLCFSPCWRSWPMTILFYLQIGRLHEK